MREISKERQGVRGWGLSITIDGGGVEGRKAKAHDIEVCACAKDQKGIPWLEDDMDANPITPLRFQRHPTGHLHPSRVVRLVMLRGRI